LLTGGHEIGATGGGADAAVDRSKLPGRIIAEINPLGGHAVTTGLALLDHLRHGLKGVGPNQ
jgi:hypothetical protein